MTRDDDLASLLAEWRERRDRGEEPDPEELCRDRPELADALRSHLGALRLVDHAFARAPEPPEGAPRRIGDFLILREIGRGGMGVVYEAEQTPMGRRVALKVLTPSFTNAPQAAARFQREARAAGRLHHTNIVPVHAMGRHEGLWYYAMELVDGQPLSRVLAELKTARTDESGAGATPKFISRPCDAR